MRHLGAQWLRGWEFTAETRRRREERGGTLDNSILVFAPGRFAEEAEMGCADVSSLRLCASAVNECFCSYSSSWAL